MQRAASKGVIHRNTVARKLSRLSARIKALPALLTLASRTVHAGGIPIGRDGCEPDRRRSSRSPPPKHRRGDSTPRRLARRYILRFSTCYLRSRVFDCHELRFGPSHYVARRAMSLPIRQRFEVRDRPQRRGRHWGGRLGCRAWWGVRGRWQAAASVTESTCREHHGHVEAATGRPMVARPRPAAERGRRRRIPHLAAPDDASAASTATRSRVRLPTRFLRDWVRSHYGDRLNALWQAENPARPPGRYPGRRTVPPPTAPSPPSPAEPAGLRTPVRHRPGPRSAASARATPRRSTRASPSTASSSASRTSSPMPAPAASPSSPPAPASTRCSSTAAWGSARPT